ncbi:restriction endonuclease subunit S [Yersinia mollaretii]|uniref:restriction endonuclease subunit S n=1 Tax=Yersinia mollaretii TaxID=33060 RepID=UPI00061C459F|nr:restriction endonuclease subunit S [Yersinia mollaretii]CNJ38974.1 restriction modification enzyme [Yersinia mollaretii]
MMENQSKMQCDKPIPAGYKPTEVGVIPEDWSVEPLTIITEPKRPISYGIVQTGPCVVNGVPCIRVVDISNGKIQTDNLITTSEKISASYRRTTLKKGDIVIPLRGKVGDIAIVDKYTQGANLTRGVALIALKKEYDSRYIRQYLSCKDSADRFLASMNGSALQEITIATLRRFPLALPSSLKEQIAIGNVLSDTDALITELEQLITKKQVIKTATMQQLLTGRTRLPQFAKYHDGAVKGYKTSELGKIPEDWKINSIGALFSISAGGDLRADEFSDIKSELHPHPIYSNAISNFGLYGYCKSYDYLGDYLTITARGGIGHAVARKGSFCAIGRLLVLSPKGISNVKFCEEYINQYLSFANESTGVPQLTAPQVAKYSVICPSIEEQTAIATILSDMDAELATLEQKFNKVRDIKQGMMQQLLTGRIRLPLEHQP